MFIETVRECLIFLVFNNLKDVTLVEINVKNFLAVFDEKIFYFPDILTIL